MFVRPTYLHYGVKIATRARPTYLPSPSRRAWSPGPTYLPLATLEKGVISAQPKLGSRKVPAQRVGFSGDRSCPFMSIFCLENRIMCLDDLEIFSELQGSSGSQRSMRIFSPKTYLPTLDVVLPPHARTYLPTLLAYRRSGPTYYEKT